MLNDRDEKFEGHEDSEYHFSDEEVSYEVEPEVQKAPAASSSTEPKENLINRLTRSRRVMISAGVFFVLVFVVYKMVSPTTPTVPTDITTAAPVAQQTAMPANQAAATNNMRQTQMAAAPAPTNMQPPAAQAMNNMQANYQAPPSAMPVGQAPQQMPMAQGAAPQAAANPAMPGAMQPMQSMPNSQMPPQQNNMPTQMTPPNMSANAMQQPGSAAAQQPIVQVVPGMPEVIPVQSATPNAYNGSQQQAFPSIIPPNVQTKINEMPIENQKLIGQLETQYAQKINDYATQNKALQDQVQTLNSRVANMESQMNQLIQALTRQPSGSAPGTNAAPMGGSNAMPVGPPPSAPPAQASEPRVSYNVQAIIPGRAWLRSDNGETVTVAEGDVIKELGRVSKIDPYDGVVEINTGSKLISLSYGNGGPQ